jgi:hypothetical protein
MCRLWLTFFNCRCSALFITVHRSVTIKETCFLTVLTWSGRLQLPMSAGPAPSTSCAASQREPPKKLQENWQKIGALRNMQSPHNLGLGNVYSLTRFCPSTVLDEHFVYERNFFFWGGGSDLQIYETLTNKLL